MSFLIPQLATNGDTSLKIWPTSKDEEKYTVNHSEEITCFVLTMDSQYVITGSRDMSLKVWQVAGGKLSQVRKRTNIPTNVCCFKNSVVYYGFIGNLEFRVLDFLE